MANFDVGPGKSYSTIQAAVNAASDGDTVRVWRTNGIPHAGNILVSGKGVSITGQEQGVEIRAVSESDGIVISGDFTGKSAFTISNLTILPHMTSYGYASGIYYREQGTSPGVTIDRVCVYGLLAGFIVTADSAGGAAGTIIKSCFMYNCIYGMSIPAEAVSVLNCTNIGSNIGIYSAAGAVIVKNTYSGGCATDFYAPSASGTSTHNAAADGSAVGSSPATITYTQAKWLNTLQGFASADYRPQPGSSLLAAGVDISGVTTDINGQSYVNGSYPIGCSLVPVFLESIPTADKIVISNSATDVYGSVTNGSAPSNTPAATPSAFSAVSSADGLTHTISVTCAETGALFEIHDASHNVVAASVASGQKIRGLTPGQDYHCHALKQI